MLKRMIAALMVLLLAGIAGAQDAPAWDVVVVEPTTGAIYTITPDGIQTGANLSDMTQFQAAYNFAITPDRGTLAFIGMNYNEDGTGTGGVFLADLTTGSCCTQLVDPLNSVMDNAMIGTFSPDGSQLVVLLYSSAAVYEGADVEALVTVFDVATGNVAANLGVNKLAGAAGGAVIVAWGERGIQLAGSCIACQPQTEGKYQFWEPASGALSEPLDPFFTFRTELPRTGEAIQQAHNTDYAHNADPNAAVYFPPSNVVTYYPVSDGDASEIIYFNPDNVHIAYALWVYDGKAVLVRHNDAADPFTQSTESALILRDGTIIKLDIPVMQTFLAATPDGWLVTDLEKKVFVHYVVQADGSVTPTELDSFVDYVLLVPPTPLLGASVTDPTFAPIAD